MKDLLILIGFCGALLLSLSPLSAQCILFCDSPISVNYSLTCEQLVTIDDVGGAIDCGLITLDIFDEMGNPVPNPIPISYFGQNLTYQLSAPDEGRVCDGDLILRNNTTLNCLALVEIEYKTLSSGNIGPRDVMLDPVCEDILSIAIKDADGNSVPIPVPADYINQTLHYIIMDNSNANSCGGDLRFTIPQTCRESATVILSEDCLAEVIATDIVDSEIPYDDYVLEIFDMDGNPVPNPVPPLPEYVCRELTGVVSFLDGTNCSIPLEVIDDRSPLLNGVAFISFTFQEYLAGAEVPPFVEDCSEVDFDFEDEELYRSCEILRIKRTYTVTDICGNSASFEQFIDILDFIGCRFIQPFELPAGLESWIYFEIPQFLQGYEINWKIESKDWKIVDQKDSDLLVVAGKSKANVQVTIEDLFLGKIYTYEQTFKGINSKQFNKKYSNAPNPLVIYPNPAQTRVNVDLTSKDKIDRIEILNFMGDHLLTKLIYNHTTSLDVANLPSGVYWIVIYEEQEKIVEKLIIAK